MREGEEERFRVKKINVYAVRSLTPGAKFRENERTREREESKIEREREIESKMELERERD